MKTFLQENNQLKPLKSGEIVEGTIIDRGRAAVFLDLGARGTGIIYGKEFYDAKERLKSLKIGEKILAKVLELDNEEGFVELSISGASRELVFDELRQKKEEGAIVKVKILGANKGGLITKVEGVPAFLPVSQLSNEHYPRVEDGDKRKILRELQKFTGQELEVKILDLSQRKEQVILSEKAKELDRQKEALKNHKIGDGVEGEVTGLTEFGVFVKFGENIEGLIRNPELAESPGEDPTQVLKVGEIIKAKIIDIQGDRVFLSRRGIPPPERDEK